MTSADLWQYFSRCLLVNIPSVELKILNQQLEPQKVSVNLFLLTKFMNTMYKSNML